MEIQENDGLVAVGQLIDLMQGLGEAKKALGLMGVARKMHKHREIRNQECRIRGEMDDWAAASILSEAAQIAKGLIGDYPNLRDELTTISERINEQLAHFS
jgi:hypothetical protein